MSSGYLLILIAWALSRLSDAGSCFLLAANLKRKKGNGLLKTSYKMFNALGIDSVLTTILLLTILPYIIFGWGEPPVWGLPWLICIASVSAFFKAYTKFKVAQLILEKDTH